MREKSELIFRVFDNTRRRVVFCSILELNDFNQPIMLLQVFDVFFNITPHVFLKLCKPFCLLRNVSGFRKESDQVKELPRRRQVLFQILALLRMRNNQYLKWWAMIQAVA